MVTTLSNTGGELTAQVESLAASTLAGCTSNIRAPRWYLRYAEAIEKWGECLTMDPDHRSYNAKLHLNRGTAFSKLRKHAEAVECCGKAIELDDKYLKAYNKRAESLRVLGEKEHLEQALRDLEKAMELAPEEQQRDYKTKMRETQGELKRAGREDLYKVTCQ